MHASGHQLISAKQLEDKTDPWILIMSNNGILS